MIKKLMNLIKNYDKIMEVIDNYDKAIIKNTNTTKKYSMFNTPKDQIEYILEKSKGEK
jgi:hypothetical protein